jgi:hypothetical protein
MFAKVLGTILWALLGAAVYFVTTPPSPNAAGQLLGAAYLFGAGFAVGHLWRAHPSHKSAPNTD